MKRHTWLIIIVLFTLIYGCSKQKINVNYKNNPKPLYTNAYIKLPLGTVKPSGWLMSQLEAQAKGLSGHIDDFWPDLKNSSWHGGDGEAWERGPYFLDGLVPLAYLLDDEELKEKVSRWIKPIINRPNILLLKKAGKLPDLPESNL